jgi:hypothetical protein
MQRRYHSAFSQGKRTEEVEEMQKEHEQIDLGPEREEAEMVRKTGRRASISEQVSTSPTPHQRRELHTTSTRSEEQQSPASTSSPADSLSTSDSPATPFTNEPPPTASKPRNRRNSFSPVPLDKSTFSAPKVTRVREKRPPSSGETDSSSRAPRYQSRLNAAQLVSKRILCSREIIMLNFRSTITGTSRSN